MREKRWFQILIYTLLAALFLGGVWISVRQYVLLPGGYTPPPTPAPAGPGPTAGPEPSAAPTSGPTPTAAPTPTPLPDLPDPVRLYFPRFEQQCDVVPVGFSEDGRSVATVDSATAAAWFELGVSPGEAGNALLNGHVSWKKQAGTFSLLKKLALGDEVVVEYADGSFRYFAVTGSDIYPVDDFPAEVQRLDPGGKPRMTLITCDGEYNREIHTRDFRAVVVCEPAEG